MLYADVTFDFPDDGFRSAALKYYPDPSRMIGFEASCVRRHERAGASDLLWGGAIDILFIRLGYNSVFDYENMFHAKGTLIAEIKFQIGAADGKFFGRGAAKPAPMETTQNSYWRKQKEQIGRIVKPGGIVISFGWNSGGIGIKYGFEKVHIRLIAHGGHHNDTIVTVEQKRAEHTNLWGTAEQSPFL